MLSTSSGLKLHLCIERRLWARLLLILRADLYRTAASDILVDPNKSHTWAPGQSDSMLGDLIGYEHVEETMVILYCR